MTYGLLASGFVKKPFAIIAEEMAQASRDNAGKPNLNFSARSNLGTIRDAFADQVSLVWDLAQAMVAGTDPDAAEDSSLDAIGILTGAYRLAAKTSKVTLDQLNLDAGTTVPAGRIVSIGENGSQFTLLEDAVNAGAYQATVSATAESVEIGPIIGYGTLIDTVQSAVSGWNQNVGLTGTIIETFVIADDDTLVVSIGGAANETFTWTTGGTFTAAQIVTKVAAETSTLGIEDVGGYIRLTSIDDSPGNSINVAVSAVATALGLSLSLVQGFNSEDAVVGNVLESNPDFRIRRLELLTATGAGTVDSIRAGVLTIPNVSHCIVPDNVTDTTDGNGIPGHSFETITHGGDSVAICQKIWDKRPAGVRPHGVTSNSVVDSQGNTQSARHTAVTEVPIYVEYEIEVDNALYPDDGDEQVAAAIKTFGDTLDIGEDIVIDRFACVPYVIAGVVEVTDFEMETVDPPTAEVNIPIAFDELATFALANIGRITPSA